MLQWRRAGDGLWVKAEVARVENVDRENDRRIEKNRERGREGG